MPQVAGLRDTSTRARPAASEKISPGLAFARSLANTISEVALAQRARAAGSLTREPVNGSEGDAAGDAREPARLAERCGERGPVDDEIVVVDSRAHLECGHEHRRGVVVEVAKSAGDEPNRAWKKLLQRTSAGSALTAAYQGAKLFLPDEEMRITRQ